MHKQYISIGKWQSPSKALSEPALPSAKSDPAHQFWNRTEGLWNSPPPPPPQQIFFLAKTGVWIWEVTPPYGRIPYNCFRHPLLIWPHMH